MFIIKQFITYIQRKQICFLCIFILVSHQVFSQGENNIICFSDSNLLNCNYNPPTLNKSSIIQLGGSSTISDGNGYLLFYTNGIDVWDKNHNRMPNGFGLYGDTLSSQSSLIIKKPNSSNIYYIFTTSFIGNYGTSDYHGLSYSIVDMNLNGGNGDIVSGLKNITLKNPCTEKITATYHANQRDIWIITREIRTNIFISYLLTPSGIIDSIFSASGTNYGALLEISQGGIEVSKNSKLLSCCLFQKGIEIHNFNNTNGFINLIFRDNTILNISNSIFSQNSQILYVSVASEVYQYNLNNLDSLAILSTKKLIFIRPFNSFYTQCAFYLSPYNKIYFSPTGHDYLGVINEPDSIGNKCRFSINHLKLNTICKLGLQNIYYFQLPTIYARNTCVDDTTRFHISDTSWMSKIIWNFGDGTGDTSFYPKHVYATTGTYPVAATYYYYTCDSVRVQHLEVKIESKPDLNLLIDKASKCNNDTNFINVSGNFDSILWNNQSKDTFRMITDTGIYTVKGFNQCGIDSAEFTISSSSGFDIDLTASDITINRGDQVELTATTDSMQDIISLEWSPNYDSCINPPLCSYVSFLPNESTRYLVTAMNIDSCISADTITINVRQDKAVFIPTVFTPNGDGLNETFDFQILGASSVFVTIWNRWGEKIYENPMQQNGVGQGWDGTYKGQAMSLGTYTYQFIVTYFDNTDAILSGTVTLMR